MPVWKDIFEESPKAFVLVQTAEPDDNKSFYFMSKDYNLYDYKGIIVKNDESLYNKIADNLYYDNFINMIIDYS